MRRISERRLRNLTGRRCRAAAFTLVELVVAIALTGILAAVVAVFLRVPLTAYEDVTRRATLTGIADTALRRMSRDMRDALPNSVRVISPAAGIIRMEYLQVRTGGRYRAQPSGGAVACPLGGLGLGFNDTFEFGAGVIDSCFFTLGATPDLGLIVPNSDFLAVFNLGPGIPNADAYASGAATGGNKSLITSVVAGAGPNVEDRFNFTANNFIFDSPSHRFFVISGPVTYECNTNPGVLTLTRYSGYPIAAAQPAGAFPAGTTAGVLANGVTGCAMTYTPGVTERSGLVSITLTLSQTNPQTGMAETVNLMTQVQVSNTP